LFFLSFYILKPLYNDFIINLIEDIFLNLYNQTVIHLLISHPISQFTLDNIHDKKKTLFIVVVATGRSNDNLISIYTNENIKFFFVFTIFFARLAIPSIAKNSLSIYRSIIYVSNWSPSTIRSTIENSLA
jgi:hydroxymethylpyrimidine pyrophosphatase-like HAD family hydrolase